MMNRLEMAQRLFDNPKLKAKDNKGNIVFCDVRDGYYKKIKLEDSDYNLMLMSDCNEEWEIIEPPRKLKEMTFGEVYYHYQNDTPRGKGYETSICSYEMKSVLTGNTLATRSKTLEEYTGNWTIEGMFEEE